jgi:hypothetical protein
MKRLLIVLVLVVAGVVGLGFYRGWFRVSAASADAKSNITFTVDKDKFQEDKKTVQEKVHDLGHAVKDKAAAATETSKAEDAPPGQPPQNQK